jgi:dihydroorotase
MSSFVLYNARLLDPATQRDELGGIRVENGRIADIGSHITATAHGQNMQGLCVAPAFIDIDVTPHESESVAQLQQRAWRGGVVTWLQQHNTAYIPCARTMRQRLQQHAHTIIRPQLPEFTGVAHDTPASYRYGLPVVPALAETLALQRDIALTQSVAGARYHALRLSSAAAVPLLPTADAAISASVSLHHLLLNYIDTVPFRTDTLLQPPLRDETDRQALCSAVLQGLIAVITSGHTQCYASAKLAPPTEATSGAADTEHLLPTALMLHHSMGASLLQALAPITCNPARLFNVAGGTLAVGTVANMVAFDPHASQRIDRAHSRHTALHGRTFEGVVRGTWQAGHRVYGEAL